LKPKKNKRNFPTVGTFRSSLTYMLGLLGKLGKNRFLYFPNLRSWLTYQQARETLRKISNFNQLKCKLFPLNSVRYSANLPSTNEKQTKNPEAAGNSLQFRSVNLSLLKKFTNCYGVKWVDLAPKTHWRGSKNKQVCKLFSPIFIWFYLRKSLANSLVHFEYTYISLSKHFAYIFVRINMIITENKQWINKDSEIKGCKT